MKLKDKIQSFKDKMDLSKKYPDYINKKVFWGGFILFMVFVFFAIFTYGFDKQWVSVECDSYLGCKNPYIQCEKDKFSEYCIFTNSLDCVGNNCDVEQIEEGDYFGEKAPPLIVNKNIIVLSIFIITFLLNHSLYKFRKK